MDEAEFSRYWNKFTKLTPHAALHTSDKEDIALFYQYLDTERSLELKATIAEQNKIMTDFLKRLSN